MSDDRRMFECKFLPFRSLGRLAWAAIVSGLVSAGSCSPAQDLPAGHIRVLVLEQKATGVPGQEAGRAVEQRIILDESGRSLVLHLYKSDSPQGTPAASADPKATDGPRVLDRRVILRLDREPPEIYEVWDAEKSFRRTIGDLNQLQEDRDRQEALELWHLSSRPAKDQEEYLRENHMRRDGKRIVSVAKVGTTTVLGRPCEEVKVFENDREVIHAWVTRDIPGAKSFFSLYRRLGAFSKEVLDRVEEIQGLPLKAEITVVTAAPAYRINAECLSLKTEVVPASVFDLPTTYREKREELDPFVICPGPGCGKKFERDQYRSKFNDNGRWVLFCSKACYTKWDAERDKEFKRKNEVEREKRDNSPATPQDTK